MIVHFLEVVALVAIAYTLGCVLGALLYDLAARGRFAAQQGVLADAVGDVVDAVSARFGVGPAWRPEQDWSATRRRSELAGTEDAATDGGAVAGRGWDEPSEVAGGADDGGPDTAGWSAQPPADGAWPEPTTPHTGGVRDPDQGDRSEERAPAASDVDADDGVAADGIVPMRPAALAAPRNGVPDNLQRIRGIGQRNEELLNGLGIFHFGQIAAWTPGEVAWIGQYIAFPERIERDDWIGQATVLASGGDTGFTKSADRRRERRQQQMGYGEGGAPATNGDQREEET